MKTQISKISLLLILLGSTYISSCDSEPPKAPAKKTLPLAAEEVKRYNPDDAALKLLNSKPGVGSADKVSSLQVPTLTITFLDATMAQVLRCDSDLELETTTGQKLDALTTGQYDFAALEQAKWIWKSAFGSGKCKLVGTNITRDNFQDLAAKPGSFFYLLNPCVSQPLSTTGKEGCSNKIIKSDVLEDYDNNLKAEFLAQAEELNKVEGELAAQFTRLKVYSEQVKKGIEVCEEAFNNEQAKGKVIDGLISITATAVGAVVGAYMGGPVGAVQGGQMMLGIAQGILGKKAPKTINCPTVEETKEKAQEVMEAIEPQVEKLVEVRTKMTELESTYHDLDDDIASQTGTQ